MRNLVVLSGAGVSAESGLKTFRDGGGLWEGHRVQDVATPEAWQRNPRMVLDFYNQRRRALHAAQPNAGHFAIKKLEDRYLVTVVTQNVDDLHERAGSKKVLHLHGELRKARSERDPSFVQEIEGTELVFGDRCPLGGQLRPHIVWFGEAVPMMDEASRIVSRADILLIVGTSLVVYPAASLVEFAPRNCRIFVVDPAIPPLEGALRKAEAIRQPASKGLPELAEALLSEAASC